MSRAKISIIGAGNVGATTAHLIAAKELGNVVLVDIAKSMSKGKALDLSQAGPVESFDAVIKGTSNYKRIQGSDIVVITAGSARKPGMSRDDLIETNSKVIKEACENIVKYSPNAILIVVTNPLDVMVSVAYKTSKFQKQRVLGMAGILDSARFRAFIAQELDVSFEGVNSIVLGSHGDSMVPLPRYSTVNGIPITELMPKEKIDAISERTKKGGAEIVNLLKTGSAFYAPAAAIVEMVESIIKDKKKILPCCVYCDKEYDVGGYFVGVPVKLGSNGIEEIIELKLTKEEKSSFKESVKHVKELIKSANKFF